MTELVDLMVTLLGEVQKVKAFLKQHHQSGYQRFNEEWVDGSQAMRMLSTSPRTMQALRDSRALPYSKVRGKIYYRVADLEKLLETHYNYKRPNYQRYGNM